MNNKANGKYIVFFAVILALAGMALAAVTFISADTAPADGTYTLEGTPGFSFNATSSTDATLNCTLFIDDVAYGINETAINNTLTTIPANATLSDGSHVWYVNCTDTEDTVQTASRTIIVDKTAPVVNLMSPANLNLTADTTPDFIFNFTDSLVNNASCTLLIGGTAYGTNSTTLNASSTTITANPALSQGSYSWAVNCTDAAGNIGNSSARSISIDTVAPTVNMMTINTNTTSATPSFNFNYTDSFSVPASCTLYFNGVSAGNNASVLNNTLTSLTSGAQENGIYSVYVNCTDTTNHVGKSGVINVTIDNSAPNDYDATDFDLLLGYGKLYESDGSLSDGFVSKASGNNLINISINISDNFTAVANVTFNFSQLCADVVVTQTSASSGLWWANCTVDQDAEFDTKNITITACDVLGTCNSDIYRSVILYNFTTPDDAGSIMQFGADTTNFAIEPDLSDVNYVLDIRLNGSQLSGTPWIGFEKAVLLNFTSLNMTSNDIGSKLQALSTAIDITISPPGAFGVNRIYVNTTAFSELDSAATITLYNLPFKWSGASQADVIADADAAGNVVIVDWEGDGTTGNLTFTVDGFSGYNATDNSTPTAEITYPSDTDVFGAGAVTINVTANGTGTAISNVIIYIDGTPNSWQAADFTCTEQSAGSEIYTCSHTLAISEGTHTIVATAYDYGGEAPGNYGNSTSITITVDTTPPTVAIASPSDGGWSNDNTSDITFSYTDSVSSTANCTLYVDDLVQETNSSVLNNTATVLTTSELAEGTHTLYINCTDEVSNEGSIASRTLTIDTHAPTVAASSPDNANTTNVTTPDFSFIANDSMVSTTSCTLYLNGVAYGTNSAVANNTLTTITANTTLIQGVYTWTVNCTDSANGMGASAARTITIDTLAPNVNIMNSSFNTTDTTPTIDFNYTDETSLTANCSLYFVDGISVANNASTLNNTLTSLTVSSAQDDGAYSVRVGCTDTQGFTDYSETITVIIDTTAPEVTITSFAYTNINTSNVTFYFTDSFSGNASCSVFINDSLRGSNVSVLNNTETTIANDSQLSEGEYTLIVNCTDRLSNQGSSTAQTLHIDQTKPTINSTISTSGTASSTTTGTATISTTTDENATCWRNTADFTAADVSGATIMSGANTTAQSFTVGYSASGNLGPYYISCRDLAGNNMNTSNNTGTIAVTITAAAVRSSGGGGGGSIARNPTASQAWNVAEAGVDNLMKITSEDFGISQVTFRVGNKTNNIKLNVEKLASRPTASDPGKTFKYLQLTKTGLTDEQLVPPIKIKFQVTKSWLALNGVDAANVVLKRLVNGSWVELPTKLLSQDDKYAYYEADTPGFSYFAISEKSQTAVTAPTPVVTPTTPVAEPVVAEQPPVEEEQTPPVEEVKETAPAKTKKTTKGSLVVTIVLAVVLLVLLVVFILLSKNKKKPMPILEYSQHSGEHHSDHKHD